MTTEQIANRLVELCRSGQFDQCYHELFHPDAVAHEMEGVPNGVTKGVDALLDKSKAFAEDMVEMHDFSVSDPVIAPGFFCVNMMIDLTKKSDGRQRAEELCLYQVKDGKIVAERFFYEM